MSPGIRLLLTDCLLQNKRRKFEKDRDDRGDRPKTPEEQEDPLANATTLYVGNLCDFMSSWRRSILTN